MKAALLARARELGFDACRITSAQPPLNASHFEQWLAAGKHGEMAYLQRNASKRVDPTQVLPGARSIIVLAVSYFLENGQPIRNRPTTTSDAAVQTKDYGPLATEVGPPSTDRQASPPSCGEIARYSRFADYHQILGRQLEDLTRFIGQQAGPSVRSLWYVDTGPLLERDLAQRAGLGFIGKHTNLISRNLGNWFFLSEIITTAELEPDSPEPNRCGSCTRCLAACPTQAISAPFDLDARRCISYLTIELKGPIPVELRPAIGTRIYGCDDCLAACPWNRFAQEGRLMRQHARPDLFTPDLLELLALDEAGFKKRFAHTPMWRTKRRGLLRNVCIALGNLGDRAALPALHRAATDPEPLIAEHALWAIDRISNLLGPQIPGT